MPPLRGKKNMLPATTVGSLSTETPMLRPRKAIVVYNERQLQARANDERKFFNNLSTIINADGILTNFNSDKKSLNRKRRFSTESITESKISSKRNKTKVVNINVENSVEIEEVIHQVTTRSNKSKVNQPCDFSNNNDKMIIKTPSTSVPTIPEKCSELNVLNTRMSNNNLEENCIPSTSNSNDNKTFGITVLKALEKKLTSEVDLNYLKRIRRPQSRNSYNRFDLTIDAVIKNLRKLSENNKIIKSIQDPQNITPSSTNGKPYVYTPRINSQKRYRESKDFKSKFLNKTKAKVNNDDYFLTLTKTDYLTEFVKAKPNIKESSVSSTRYSSELTDSPVSSPKCIELTDSATPLSMLSTNSSSSTKYNNELSSVSDSMSRYNELMINCHNYNLKNNTPNSFLAGNKLLETCIPANNSYDEVFRYPQARAKLSILQNTIVDVAILGRAIFHDDIAWTFPKRSLFGHECVVYFYKSMRWKDRKLIFVPYGKGVVIDDIPYTCGSCFKISACLKHRFDLQQRNKIPIVIARKGKFIDDPDWPKIPHICDPSQLTVDEKNALIEYGEIMAKTCNKLSNEESTLPNKKECRNLLIIVEARLTECCVKLLSVGFDFTHKSMKEKAIEIASEINLPKQCVTDEWLSGVASRIGVPDDLPTKSISKIKPIAKSNKKKYYQNEESTSPSIGSDDYNSQSDSCFSVESNNSNVKISGNFSNINDYLQNMVKEAMLTHQFENSENNDIVNDYDVQSKFGKKQNSLPLFHFQENTAQRNLMSELVTDQSAKNVSVIVKESCPIEFVSEGTHLNKSNCGDLIHAKANSKFEKEVNNILIKNEVLSNDEDEPNNEKDNAYSQIDELIETDINDKVFNNTKKFKKFFTRIRKSVPMKSNADDIKISSTIKTLKNPFMNNNPSTSMTIKEFLFRKQNLKQLKTENKILQNVKNDHSNIVENTNDSISTLVNKITGSTMDSANFDRNTTLQTVLQSSFIKTNLSEVDEALKTIKAHILERDCSLMPIFNNFSSRIAKMMFTTKPKSSCIDNKNKKEYQSKSNQLIKK